MATIQDIINYVQHTTYNTNLNVLIPMINSLAAQIKILISGEYEFIDSREDYLTAEIDLDLDTIKNKDGIVLTLDGVDYPLTYSDEGGSEVWYYDSGDISLTLEADSQGGAILYYTSEDATAGTYTVEISEKESSGGGGDLPENIKILEAIYNEIDETVSFSLDGVILDEDEIYDLLNENFLFTTMGPDIAPITYNGGNIFINDGGNQVLLLIPTSDNTKFEFMPLASGQYFVNNVSKVNNEFVADFDYAAIRQSGLNMIVNYNGKRGLLEEGSLSSFIVSFYDGTQLEFRSTGITEINLKEYTYILTPWNDSGLTLTGATEVAGGLAVVDDRTTPVFIGGFDIPAGNTVTITLPTITGGSDYNDDQNCYLVISGEIVELTWDKTTSTFTYTNTKDYPVTARIGGSVIINSHNV